MKLIYHTANTPTPGDPLGMAPNGDGVASRLDAKLLSESSGSFSVVVRDGAGGVSRIDGVAEGESPGEVSVASGLTNTASKALRTALTSISSEGGAVGIAADAVIAMLTGTNARTVAQSLVSVATNSQQSDGNRINALILLALVVAEERER